MDVLLVEDNPDAGLALSLLLQMEGFRVRHVCGVQDALAALASAPPDVVVSDLRLPDGSGCEVARALPDGVAAVATSGLPREDAWAECAEAGFVEYLQKPVDFTTLARMIRSLGPPR